MEKTTKKRDESIDVTKGILIFLVVWGHSIQFGFGYEYGESYHCFNDYVFRMIYSFHMPLFMAISGYLYYKSNMHPFFDIVKKRLMSIGVPYLVYCTFLVLVLLPTSIWGGQKFEVILSSYKSGFWFLTSVLFNCITVSVLTLISREKGKILMLLLLTTFIYSILPDKIVDGKYNCMFICFITGYILNMINVKLFPIKRTLWAFPLIAFSMVIASILYDGWMYTYPKEFGDFNYAAISNIKTLYEVIQRSFIRIAGCVSFIFLTAWYESFPLRIRKVLCNLSRYSLGVYCTTTIMLSVYYKIMGSMGINISHNYVYPVILAIMLTTISYRFFSFCERNRMLNALFLGGR